ncbi:2-phospho-L-lactate transferase [Cutibacterium acnes JCM 18916]|nr:2-phospho-L-lactate transferase [Cutibacterium acnes JCM 18916]
MVSTPSKLPVVTAFGGGHGLAVSLRALRRLTDQLTAVVTVADNGGSSGRLRDEFDILPPGDLRRALAALCADDRLGRTWLRFCKLDLMELANSPVTPLATS